MSYDIEAREFDPVTRGVELAVALGEVIPDLLGSMTTLSNPYVPNLATVGTATSYTVTLDTQEITTSTNTTNSFVYASAGTETYKELLTALVLEGNTTFGNYLVWTAFTDYNRDEDMYFTLAPKNGYRIVTQPVVTNITISTEKVQAPIDKPSAYLAMQKVIKPNHPLLIVTPSPVTSVNENWKQGSVQLDLGKGAGLQYYPHYDSYVKCNYRITVESGAYDEVLTGSTRSAESILQILKMRLKEQTKNDTFVNKIDATFNPNMMITPAPVVGSTEWMSIAGMTMELDIIDRYIEAEGGIMTSVEIAGSDLRQQGNAVAEIPMDFTVSRTDIP